MVIQPVSRRVLWCAKSWRLTRRPWSLPAESTLFGKSPAPEPAPAPAPQAADKPPVLTPRQSQEAEKEPRRCGHVAGGAGIPAPVKRFVWAREMERYRRSADRAGEPKPSFQLFPDRVTKGNNYGFFDGLLWGAFALIMMDDKGQFYLAYRILNSSSSMSSPDGPVKVTARRLT